MVGKGGRALDSAFGMYSRCIRLQEHEQLDGHVVLTSHVLDIENVSSPQYSQLPDNRVGH